MRSAAATGILLVCIAHAAHAEFSAPVPQDIPIERLTSNVTRYLQAHPRDPQAYYILGRVHSLAYAQASDNICGMYYFKDRARSHLPIQSRSMEENPTFLPEVDRSWRIGVQAFGLSTSVETEGFAIASIESLLTMPSDALSFMRKQVGKIPGQKVLDLARRKLSSRHLSRLHRERAGNIVTWLTKYEVAWSHLLSAEKEYATALELQPNFPVASLGLAWVKLELGKTLEAAHLYHAAYSGTAHAALNGSIANAMAFYWHGCIALEASEKLLELVPKLPCGWQALDVNAVCRDVAALRSLVRQKTSITPILVSLVPDTTLNDILATGFEISFDLLGTGFPQKWPWVTPNAGILVWDPNKTGNIVTGRQLFGNVTWFIFWENGYRPLQFLDDNADGTLSGNELTGLAIWRDTNLNGISDRNEVTPAANFGIISLEYQATLTNAGPFCKAGVRLTDGTSRPSFDWIVTPSPLPPSLLPPTYASPKTALR